MIQCAASVVKEKEEGKRNLFPRRDHSRESFSLSLSLLFPSSHSSLIPDTSEWRQRRKEGRHEWETEGECMMEERERERERRGNWNQNQFIDSSIRHCTCVHGTLARSFGSVRDKDVKISREMVRKASERGRGSHSVRQEFQIMMKCIFSPLRNSHDEVYLLSSLSPIRSRLFLWLIFHILYLSSHFAKNDAREGNGEDDVHDAGSKTGFPETGSVDEDEEEEEDQKLNHSSEHYVERICFTHDHRLPTHLSQSESKADDDHSLSRGIRC